MNFSKLANTLLVLVACTSIGCVETELSASCEGPVDRTGVSGSILGNGGAGGSGGEGSGGSAGSGIVELLGDGAPCSTDEECTNEKCMPSKNSYGSGYCYSLAMEGCIVVTAPSPLAVDCASPLKRLFVCGESWPVASLGANCVDIATGELGEHYHCCPKI